MKTPSPTRPRPLMLVAAHFAALCLTGGAVFGFAGGDGSPGDPFLVASAEHLDAARNHLGAHFLQTAHIDLGGAPWNEGGGWVPLGASTAGTRFTGSYDGGGFTIANLTIQRSTTSTQGLFGYLDGASVRGVVVTGAAVVGASDVGILAGRAVNSMIEDVRVSGAVTGAGTASHTGGLAGYIFDGRVHRVWVNAVVQGNSKVGGLAGYLTNHGEIRHSSVRGSVGGGEFVGGLVGQMLNGSQYLSDCYSRAAASGTAWVGGLVGHSGLVYRCYSSGAVSGPEGVATIGGLTGQSTNVRDSFWDVESSGRATSGGGTGLTTSQMQDPASFQNFNFHSLWEMESGGYPVFRDFSGYAPPAAVVLGTLAGDGSAGDPYILTSAAELNAMRQDLGAHYRLGNNIDLRDAVLWDMGRGWSPVGVSTAGQRFTGTLDGAGFTILKLALNRPPTGDQGLFGYVEAATLRDLRLEQANLQGGATSGLLVGRALGSTLEQISVQGQVRCGGSKVGGVAGEFNGGAMHRADANVVAQGGSQVGGLTGYLTNHGEIRHCSAHGSVAGGEFVGGLVGQMLNGSQYLSDCYSRAAASGTAWVGGLVGHSGLVYRCYSSGAVSGPEGVATIGGLTGQSTNVRDSFWDVESSGRATSGGGTGLTTSQMQDAASFQNFNFHSLWEMESGGYPVFRDFSGYAPPAAVVLGTLAGDGSAGDPYILTSAAELNAMRQDLGAHYRLGNNIDLRDSVLWDMGRGWSPVGVSTAGQRFTGTLDGAGFTILKLAINRPPTGDQGLFGYVEGATLRDLRLEQVNLQGGATSGLLVGQALGSTLEQISVQGRVRCGGSQVGGLAGVLNGGAMHRADANVVAQGANQVGGLVGYFTNNGEIRHCSARGSVVGGDFVGGLVGQMLSGSQYLSDCYSRAAASGTAWVGGLVGHSGLVYRCYSSGAVSGPEGVATIGGLTGQSTNVRDSFWDVESSGRATSGGGTGLTTSQMQDPASFQNFNFHSLWEMESGGYPVFRDFSGYAPPAAVVLGTLAGDGSAGDPYILANASELNAMRQDLGAHYRLGNDIDLRDAVLWDMGRGWSPVGVATVGQRFTGTLDGAGFKILNLALNRPPTAYQGLFGYVEGATLRDLRIEQGHLQGGATSGLLAGQALGSTIEQVSVQGLVRCGGSQVGGLAGVLYGGTTYRADANVVVQGANQLGGLVGYLTNHGQIHRSSARGSVGGGTDVGGLIGQMYNGSQLVSDSYSRAAVGGANRAGGLVGYIWSGNVSRSYATGLVNAASPSSSNLGGLSGTGANVQAGYWDMQTSGQSHSGGGAGRSSAAMSHPHASDTYIDWDFAETWAADADGSVNGGYPYLRTTGQNPQSGGPFTLVYQVGAGGGLAGPTLQTVAAGATASAVHVIPEPGAIFVGWSDGSMANPRADELVSRDVQVTARFESAGGVDLDWYAGHGIAPGEGQTWSDLDILDWLGKGMTLQEEFLAGTDPNDPLSRFAVEAPVIGPGGAITLAWSSVEGRTYGVMWSTDLAAWNELEVTPGSPLRVAATAGANRTETSFGNPSDPVALHLFFRIFVVSP